MSGAICKGDLQQNFMLVTWGSAMFMKSVDSTDPMADGGKKNAA